MKLILLFALAIATSQAALKWTGLRMPPKVSAEDGVVKLDRKIGTFTTLSPEQATQGIFDHKDIWIEPDPTEMRLITLKE